MGVLSLSQRGPLLMVLGPLLSTGHLGSAQQWAKGHLPPQNRGLLHSEDKEFHTRALVQLAANYELGQVTEPLWGSFLSCRWESQSTPQAVGSELGQHTSVQAQG